MTVAPKPAHDAGSGEQTDRTRDRFVSFAFVAADLLVEASPDGIIGFAAGAFIARLGAAPEAFIGRHVSQLVAPLDQTAFCVALAMAATHGRSLPLLVRLADLRQTQVSVASLLVPGPRPRLCLTFGAAPAASSNTAGGPPQMTEGPACIVHAALSRLRAGPEASAQVGLIELKGWTEARRVMGEVDHDQLRQEIGAALAACAPGSLTSEVADGRFSVLGCGQLDLQAVIERLERLLSAGPANLSPAVAGTELTLASGAAHGGLAPAQAARALRFALACFAERGVPGALAAGASEGLGSIMARAESRAIELRKAIAERRFRLRFQPIAALADRRVHHYEALLRPFATTDGAAVSTQEYVCFAELVGLAEDLDAAVLQVAIEALVSNPRVSIAVNVSGLSIQSAAFVERTLAAVRVAGLGRRLVIELTETAEIADMAAAASHMAQLRAAEVSLCLDDFGAGAASFRYLRELAVDIVKIDGSYVRRALRSPRERSFVASIVDLATSVHAGTVAEMIETEEEASLMAELGVVYGQGWLLGRPGRLP